MKSIENLRTGSIDFSAMLAIVGFFCLYFLTTASIESYGSDTSTYYELAKSLLHDRKYWFNFEPHTIYPPGFPVLLACLMSFLGESFEVLVKGSLVICFISLIGIYYLVRIHRGSKTAFATVVVIATSYVFYFFSTTGLYSEGPYLLASVYALLLFEFGIRSKNEWSRFFALFVVSTLIAYLFLLRSIGITLLIALILWMVNPIKLLSDKLSTFSWDRIRRLFPVLLMPIIAFVVWTTWCAQNRLDSRNGDYMGSYATQLLKEDPHQIDSPNIALGDIPSRMLQMADIRVKNAARMLFNLPSRALVWTNPILLLFFAVLLIGFVCALVGEGRLLDYYVLSYAGVLLLWPFDEGTRFLLPIQPFLMLYVIDGIERLFNMVGSKRLKKYYLHFASMFAMIMLFTLVEVYLEKRMSGNHIVSLVSGALLCSYLLYLRFGDSGGLPDKVNPANIQGAFLHRIASFSTAKVALFMAIVTLGLIQLHGAALRNLNPDPGTFVHAPTVKISNWIAQNTRVNDIIMIDEYEILHRLTKRKTYRFPLVTDPGLLRDRIIENTVDFLVILNEKEFEYYSPSTMRRFESVKTLSPELFIPEYDFDQGVIYRVVKANRRSRSQS